VSIDYNVFLKDSAKISISDFENYAHQLGYKIKMYPLEDFLSHSGFLPFNICPDFMKHPLPYDSMLSGFELYFDEYDAENYDENFTVQMNYPRLAALLCFSGMDSLELFVTLLFAGYLCRCCNGVFYDPQEDQFISDAHVLEEAVKEYENYLNDPANKSSLVFHEFKGFD